MKYVIDIPDDNISDFLTLGDDKRLRLPIYNKNGTFNSFIPTNLTVIPYTEPDKNVDEIHVGDEVKNKECGWKAFVTNITNTGCLTLMWGFGEASSWHNPKDFEKTGKHCAEVEELIKKINEVQHDE